MRLISAILQIHAGGIMIREVNITAQGHKKPSFPKQPVPFMDRPEILNLLKTISDYKEKSSFSKWPYWLRKYDNASEKYGEELSEYVKKLKSSVPRSDRNQHWVFITYRQYHRIQYQKKRLKKLEGAFAKRFIEYKKKYENQV